MFKAVIFDMDGTMVDTEVFHSMAYEEVLKHFGADYKSRFEDMDMRRRGLLHSDVAKMTIDEFDMNITVEEFLEYRKKAYMTKVLESDIQPRENLIPLLKDLKSKGIRLAVASSSFQDEVQYVTKKIGVHQYFEEFVSGDQIINGKPAPDIFLRAASLLGQEPNDCIVFEDAKAGIRAGNSADMAVIAYKTDDTDMEELREAYYICKNYGQLNYKALEELFSL